MGLQGRDRLVEVFSSFIKICDDRERLDNVCLIFPPLKKNMESQIEKYPDGNEDYWALFWLKQALKNSKMSLAWGHLSAYLEEVCYWITVKDIKDILKIYNLNQADGFLMVRAIAAEPKFLKKYDFNKGTKIKTYARPYLRMEALERIRSGNAEEKFSDTGKLRYLSKKQFTDRLNLAGIKDPKFSELLLARQCFHEIYTAKTPKGFKTLPWPAEEKLVEIADCYNLRRNPETQAINSQILKQMLKECQQIIRDYSPLKRLYQLSHGDSLEGIEEQYEWKEMQTDFDDLEYSSFSADKLSEVNSLLLKAFEKLNSEERKILQLLIGLKITQSDIAKLLGISQQSQVSRKKESAKATLLKALAPWIVKNFNIQLSSEQLNGISPQLEEWLEQHCMAAFNDCLKTTLIQSFSSDIPILVSLYFKPRDGKQLKPKVIAKKYKMSESELEQKVEQIQQQLQDQLMVYLKKRLKVSLKPYPSAHQKIATFVNTWLETAPYATFR
jgi:RNA polymerase sigma factor (sigma-70 family)